MGVSKWWVRETGWERLGGRGGGRNETCGIINEGSKMG